MSARTARLLLAVAAVAVLAGCGNKEAVVKHAHTEGIYLDVGELDYQVQLSRIINPGAVPDKSYLTGLPEGFVKPNRAETWFGVFMRVQNQTDGAHPVGRDFEIIDTQENKYTPIDLDPDANSFAYAETVLAPGAVLPPVDSTTSDSPTQGALLLFKLPFTTLQNRPLEFKIKQGSDEAVVDLDV